MKVTSCSFSGLLVGSLFCLGLGMRLGETYMYTTSEQSSPLERHGRVCQCNYCLHLHYSLLSWTSSLIHPIIFGPVHFLDIFFLTCIAARGQTQKQVVLHIGDIICHSVFILKQLKTGRPRNEASTKTTAIIIALLTSCQRPFPPPLPIPRTLPCHQMST